MPRLSAFYGIVIGMFYPTILVIAGHRWLRRVA